MSGVEASREFKAVIHGDTPFTVDTLANVVDRLKGHLDVPGNAKLSVTRIADSNWTIIAKWDPAEDGRPGVTIDVQPGTIDAEVIAERLQRDSRGFTKIHLQD